MSCSPISRQSAAWARLSGSQDRARDEREECGERGREVERVKVQVRKHWPVPFWVRGGDKMGAHRTSGLMRDGEGGRKGERGSEIYNG